LWKSSSSMAAHNRGDRPGRNRENRRYPLAAA
jgi:hypothetical protein